MNRRQVCVFALGLALVFATGASAQVVNGKVLIEYWFGNGLDNNLDNLKANADFPDNSAYGEYLDAMEKPDFTDMDYWGGMLRAWVTPPQTGDYTFWTASDDDSEVWLSTDDNPANAKLICNVEGWMGFQDWTYTTGSPGTTYKSVPITLEAGKRYYMETLVADGTGGGFVSVAWAGPGIGDAPTVIGSAYLSAPVSDAPFIARSPVPASGSVDVTAPLFTWTAAPNSAKDDIYFGTNPTPGLAEFKGTQVSTQQLFFFMDPAGLTPGATYYWRVDTTDTDGVLHTGRVWSFTVMPAKATEPSPAEGAIFVSLTPTLGWKAGQNTPTHNLYLSADKAAVTDGNESALKARDLVDASIDVNGLAPETTYYWRVDEVDAAGTTFVGDVWSFNTTLKACGKIKREIYEGTGSGTAVSNLTGNAKFPLSPTRSDEVTSFRSPDLGISNYGGSLSAFLHVPVDGDYTFWIASDDSSDLYFGATAPAATRIASVSGYSGVDEWGKFASQTSAVQTLKAGVYFIQALWKEGGGGDHCSVAWQGPGIPRQVIPGTYCEPFIAYWARIPSPSSGATGVIQAPTLKWAPGVKAAKHDIYFGDDAAAVAAANPYSLLYMGRVSADVLTFEPGPLEWNKTYYWRVDEINPAEPGNPWIGGVWSFKTADYLIIENAQKTLGYDNFNSPFFTEQVYTVPADWTTNGINALRIEFQGAAVAPTAAKGSTTIDGPGAYTLTGAGTDVWNTTDQFQFACMKLTGDGSIVAKVESVENKNVWAKGGVMIRQSAAPNSMYAIMAMTGGGAATGGGVNFQWRPTTGASAAGGPNGPGVTCPYWVKLDRVGNVITAFSSPDGVAWTQLGDPQTIVMTETVLMGLFYTSHVDNKTLGTAKFTNVVPTGNVDPASANNLDIGYANSAQPIYVAVQDAAGKLAVATYPEAAATNIPSWTMWKVPLSDLAGLDLTNIAKLSVGVGDSLNPTADGVGVINIRNVRVVKPVVLPVSDVPIDITDPGDNVLGLPNNFNWPAAEFPRNAIDNGSAKFLNFSGATLPTGFSVQPFVGATVVTGLTFTAANDSPERDPVKFELSGSNDSIQGPWTPIAAGDIVDFAGATTWPRNTIGSTPIAFPNTTAYKFYQLMFPACRGPNQNSMQIREVELLGVLAQ